MLEISNRTLEDSQELPQISSWTKPYHNWLKCKGNI